MTRELRNVGWIFRLLSSLFSSEKQGQRVIGGEHNNCKGHLRCERLRISFDLEPIKVAPNPINTKIRYPSLSAKHSSLG